MKSLKSLFRPYKGLLTKTWGQFWNRQPFNSSIIISYYTIFALPGLLVIVINIAGYFYTTKVVSARITTEIQSMIGGDTAKNIQAIIDSASKRNGSIISSIIGLVVMLFGATGVFYQIQQILNTIWQVKPKPKEQLLKQVKDRLFSFGLILAVGFLLLISLVVSAGLTAFSNWLNVNLSASFAFAFKALDILVSLAVITIMFAAIFKFLPDAKIKWKDVWSGAILTAILFVIAKYALGLYFGKSNPASTYGAAGTIVLILLWVSYAGLILLYGAEFTNVYATRDGKQIPPTEAAVSVDSPDAAGQTVSVKKDPLKPGLKSFT